MKSQYCVAQLTMYHSSFNSNLFFNVQSHLIIYIYNMYYLIIFHFSSFAERATENPEIHPQKTIVTKMRGIMAIIRRRGFDAFH